MIITALLYIIYYTLYVILSPIFLFSDVSLESGFGEAVANASHYLASANTVLPISSIVAILALIVSIEVIIATYKLIMWVIRRIPTQS